jgi:hypothetical protein
MNLFVSAEYQKEGMIDMRSEQRLWTEKDGWQPPTAPLESQAQLVLIFGSPGTLRDTALFQDIKNAYPHAHLVGCSTAGEICGINVFDETLTSTAVFFEDSTVQVQSKKIADRRDSAGIGDEIGRAINKKNLAHVFVLSDGLNVNGSTLVNALSAHLPDHVVVTGGLAAQGELFEETLVVCDGPPQDHLIAAVCFYGNRLKLGFGSMGGWDPFGPERVITRSSENILYELDGKSALDLYKTYLGDYAKNLPASALLFPLSIRTPQGDTSLVRTILAINPADQGMVFAGDIPEGSYARFMKANTNRLIDGAGGAAKISHPGAGHASPDLAILISCVGRKMVLKQRVEEEIESVRDILGERTVLTGFYSYGEIAPSHQGSGSALHNQTMTITTLSEKR